MSNEGYFKGSSRGRVFNGDLEGDLEWDLEGDLEVDLEGDSEGDFKQDMEGDLLSSSAHVRSGLVHVTAQI